MKKFILVLFLFSFFLIACDDTSEVDDTAEVGDTAEVDTGKPLE